MAQHKMTISSVIDAGSYGPELSDRIGFDLIAYGDFVYDRENYEKRQEVCSLLGRDTCASHLSAPETVDQSTEWLRVGPELKVPGLPLLNLKRDFEKLPLFLGSIDLLGLALAIPHNWFYSKSGTKRISPVPGHDCHNAALVVRAREGSKLRVAAWRVSSDRSFGGKKDDALYLRGTNNRLFPEELSREIVKLF